MRNAHLAWRSQIIFLGILSCTVYPKTNFLIIQGHEPRAFPVSHSCCEFATTGVWAILNVGVFLFLLFPSSFFSFFTVKQLEIGSNGTLLLSKMKLKTTSRRQKKNICICICNRGKIKYCPREKCMEKGKNTLKVTTAFSWYFSHLVLSTWTTQQHPHESYRPQSIHCIWQPSHSSSEANHGWGGPLFSTVFSLDTRNRGNYRFPSDIRFRIFCLNTRYFRGIILKILAYTQYLQMFRMHYWIFPGVVSGISVVSTVHTC